MSSKTETEQGEKFHPEVVATVRTEYFKEYLDAINAVVDEYRLEFTETGFRVEAVDPANVSTVAATLELSDQNYDEQAPSAGINVNHVREPLDDMEEELRLAFRPDKRELTISDEHYQITLKTIKPGSIREGPDLPEFEGQCSFTVDAHHLKRATKHADQVGGHIALEHIEGEETARIVLSGDCNHGEYHVPVRGVANDQTARASYSRDYFGSMMDPVSDEAPLQVEFDTEYPISITRGLAPEGLGEDDARYQGQVEYMVAPRLGSKDDWEAGSDE